MRTYRIVGWVCLAFSVLCIVGALWIGQYWPVIVFSFFALLGIYIVMGAGSFDIDSNHIKHTSRFGAWQIGWDEISQVEVGEMDGTLVLKGNNKRFILSPAGWWAGPDKSDAIAFVDKQLETRKLSPRASRTAAYKVMKNTRIK